jgi:superfamily I DNA/RNA helicase
VELIALQSAADHRSTHWQLVRLLHVDESDVADASRLHEALRNSDDEGLERIASLCHASNPAALIASLSDIEMPPDADLSLVAGWEDDCRLLTDAWRSFAAQAQAAEQTWANFRLHISRTQQGYTGGAGVRLMTIHKAQGREFRVVVIIGLNEGQLPDFRARAEDEQLAELRAFYVAVTRASRALMVTRACSRETRYGLRATQRSPYWSFLPAAG